jgi:hypothetical protein
MRLFLLFMLLDIVFRPLGVLYPWKSWCEALEMPRFPARFSTRAEIDKLREREAPKNPNPVFGDFCEALRSAWGFADPVPTPDTVKKLKDWPDYARYSLAWLNSRFAFFEEIVGFDQEWPMFSPNVSKRRVVTRACLYYADKSVRLVRTLADPEDLTSYAHWFEDKRLNNELQVRNRKKDEDDDANGWCNLLAHRYPTSDAGSPLVRIVLYEVLIKFAPPDVDATEFYQEQMRRTADATEQERETSPQVYWPHYEYNVAERRGRQLPER